MDLSTVSGCHNVTAQSGDVDTNGELVDALTLRLQGAVGEFVAADLDPAEHVDFARGLVLAARGFAGDDDTAGTADHNRRAPAYRDHGEEIAAALAGRQS